MSGSDIIFFAFESKILFITEESLMNKADLINALAEQNGMTKKEAEKAVSAVISIIGEALKNGDKVQIMGFGSFEVKERAARTAVNPATKAKMDIPASKVISFKAGKALKDSVQ